MSDTALDLPIDAELFLLAISEGTPPDLAAHEVNWTPTHLRRQLANSEFASLVRYAQRRRDDGIERVLYDQARKGNMVAIQIILFNRRPEEFRDVKRVEVTTKSTIEVSIVQSVKAAALELMQEQGAAVLQIGGAIDAESREEP